MSKIGNKKIVFTEGITINFERNILRITGKYGEETLLIPESLTLIITSNVILVKCLILNTKTRAIHGLIRSLINNIIIGVEFLYKKVILLEGIGYKVKINLLKTELELFLGFTKNIIIAIPSGIQVQVETATKFSISGINKQQVTSFAAKLKMIKPPEPYNGKGVLILGEIYPKKVGKTGRSGKTGKLEKVQKTKEVKKGK